MGLQGNKQVQGRAAVTPPTRSSRQNHSRVVREQTLGRDSFGSANRDARQGRVAHEESAAARASPAAGCRRAAVGMAAACGATGGTPLRENHRCHCLRRCAAAGNCTAGPGCGRGPPAAARGPRCRRPAAAAARPAGGCRGWNVGARGGPRSRGRRAAGANAATWAAPSPLAAARWRGRTAGAPAAPPGTAGGAADQKPAGAALAPCRLQAPHTARTTETAFQCRYQT